MGPVGRTVVLQRWSSVARDSGSSCVRYRVGQLSLQGALGLALFCG